MMFQALFKEALHEHHINSEATLLRDCLNGYPSMIMKFFSLQQHIPLSSTEFNILNNDVLQMKQELDDVQRYRRKEGILNSSLFVKPPGAIEEEGYDNEDEDEAVTISESHDDYHSSSNDNSSSSASSPAFTKLSPFSTSSSSSSAMMKQTINSCLSPSASCSFGFGSSSSKLSSKYSSFSQSDSTTIATRSSSLVSLLEGFDLTDIGGSGSNDSLVNGHHQDRYLVMDDEDALDESLLIGELLISDDVSPAVTEDRERSIAVSVLLGHDKDGMEVKEEPDQVVKDIVENNRDHLITDRLKPVMSTEVPNKEAEEEVVGEKEEDEDEEDGDKEVGIPSLLSRYKQFELTQQLLHQQPLSSEQQEVKKIVLSSLLVEPDAVITSSLCLKQGGLGRVYYGSFRSLSAGSSEGKEKEEERKISLKIIRNVNGGGCSNSSSSGSGSSSSSNNAMKEQLENEMVILKILLSLDSDTCHSLHHPNLLSVYGYLLNDSLSTMEILLEYSPYGSLDQLILHQQTINKFSFSSTSVIPLSLLLAWLLDIASVISSFSSYFSS
jgi:hypothetical protein